MIHVAKLVFSVRIPLSGGFVVPRLCLLVIGLDAKPVLACAYGLVITGLLVVGLGITESLEPEENAAPPLGNPWFAQTPALPPNPAVARPLNEQTNLASSVIPVFTSSAPRFLFDVNRLKVEQVSYSLR